MRLVSRSKWFVCLFVYFTSESDVLFWALLKRCEVRTLVHRRGKKKKTIFLTLAFSQRDGRQGFEIRLFRSIPAFRFNPNLVTGDALGLDFDCVKKIGIEYF